MIIYYRRCIHVKFQSPKIRPQKYLKCILRIKIHRQSNNCIYIYYLILVNLKTTQQRTNVCHSVMWYNEGSSVTSTDDVFFYVYVQRQANKTTVRRREIIRRRCLWMVSRQRSGRRRRVLRVGERDEGRRRYPRDVPVLARAAGISRVIKAAAGALIRRRGARL